MLEQLIEPILNLTTLQILIIFSIVSITNGIILMPSSQLILITAGIISQTNNVNPILFLTILIITNTFGNWVLYFLAYKHGEKFARKFIPIKKEKLDNHLIILDYLFKRFGNYIIVIGRNLPLFHSLISVPAGISKIPNRLYLWYTTIGITIWTLIFFYIGYYTGTNFEQILSKLETTASLAIIGFFILNWILIKKYYGKILKTAKQYNKTHKDFE